MLHKLLGDETFAALGEMFVAAHPSVHRSIRWYGSELADFMSRCPPFSEQPILSEVARFEWTLAEVFDAPDAAALERSALQAIEPDAWAGIRFRFHPSVRRMSLAWNTVNVWQAVSRDEEPPQPELGAAARALAAMAPGAQELFPFPGSLPKAPRSMPPRAGSHSPRFARL